MHSFTIEEGSNRVCVCVSCGVLWFETKGQKEKSEMVQEGAQQPPRWL